MSRRWGGLITFFIANVTGCAPAATDRPQLLVYLDTDLPVSAQVLSDSALSPDAAIDTLRIDVLDASGATSLPASAHGQVVNGLPKHDVSAQSILPSASLSTPSWHSASVRSAAHLVTEGLI